MGKNSQVINEHTDVICDHMRRIAALEAHIQDLEDRLNERGVFSGARDAEHG